MVFGRSGFVWVGSECCCCFPFSHLWIPRVAFVQLLLVLGLRGLGANPAAVSLFRMRWTTFFNTFQRSRYRHVLNGLGTNPAAVFLFRALDTTSFYAVRRSH